MDTNKVRISFDILPDEHVLLKTECAQGRIQIKDFMHEWMLKGLNNLAQQRRKARLNLAYKQVSQGKAREITLDELESMERQLDEE